VDWIDLTVDRDRGALVNAVPIQLEDFFDWLWYCELLRDSAAWR
jgi:hypothetical protein